VNQRCFLNADGTPKDSVNKIREYINMVAEYFKKIDDSG
jgi:hypothetical protein